MKASIDKRAKQSGRNPDGSFKAGSEAAKEAGHVGGLHAHGLGLGEGEGGEENETDGVEVS